MYQWSLGASKLLDRYQIFLWLTHLVSKPKQPQNLRTPLYSAGTPPWSPAGGYKSLKTAKPLKQGVRIVDILSLLTVN